MLRGIGFPEAGQPEILRKPTDGLHCSSLLWDPKNENWLTKT